MRVAVVLCSLAVGACSAGVSNRGERIVQVPTQLAIARGAESLTVGIDPGARKPVRIRVTPRRYLGVKSVLRVHPVGGAPIEGGVGLSSGTEFDVGERIFHRHAEGIPVPGQPYRVEIDVELFETDVPPGHMWSPQTGAYKVLWSRALSQTVN